MAAPPPNYQQTAYDQQTVVVQQPAVVVQQPVSSFTTTVVTHQQMSLKGWSSGICDCATECKSCWCAICCGNFYYAAIASRMGENCCVGCSGYPAGCVPGGHLAMRSRFRGSHNIHGNICGDCIMDTFCLPCAMCQLSREMDHLGYPQNC